MGKMGKKGQLLNISPFQSVLNIFRVCQISKFLPLMKLEIHPKESHENISLENLHTNMKVGGITSTFQVCIVYFLVFWGPGKFGLREAPFRLAAPLFGQYPNSDYT